MLSLDEIEQKMLKEVAGIESVPAGAYNFRVNGQSVGRRSSKNIEVIPKNDKSGLEIRIRPNTKNEAVHIPVIISASGLTEAVYNDFYIGENSDVAIVAGCGIYNCGADDSIHDGIHTFYVGKNARVRYIEKHYGAGPGAGKILNPVTKLYLEPGSYVELEMEQLRGVDSTCRQTYAELKEKSKILINERLLTHGRQSAQSEIEVRMLEKNSSVDIVSRAVARDQSHQNFCSHIIGAAACRGHSECDAIMMEQAQVLATPTLEALDLDAELIHEAAIGKIAGAQLIKLMTLGLTRGQAESQIVNAFLK